jgi:3-hydroxyisobutyrate dehydrogenase
MGFPMARNIAQAGIPVRAWNRSAERAAPLAEHGATVCDSPAEAVDGADVLVTMLSDGPTTETAVAGVLRPGLLWLQMGTVGVDWVDTLARLAEDARAIFVDSPVLGTRTPAEAGELTVLASGPAGALEAGQPVFDAVGSRTLVVGETAGSGSRLKLVMNFWILAQTALGGEVLALAEALGVGGQRFLEMVTGTIADSAYLQARGPRMLASDWAETNFRLELARKDVSLAVEAGAANGLDLTIARAVVEEMARGIERGYGDADFSSVIEATRAGSA